MTGFRTGHDTSKCRNEISVPDLRGALASHLLDVCASSKGLFATGYHHGANPLVLVKRLQRIHQLTEQLIVNCVLRLGTIKGDQANRPAYFCQDHFVGHGISYEECVEAETIRRLSKCKSPFPILHENTIMLP